MTMPLNMILVMYVISLGYTFESITFFQRRSIEYTCKCFIVHNLCIAVLQNN